MKAARRLLVSHLVALLAVGSLSPCLAAGADDSAEMRLSQIERSLDTNMEAQPQFLEEISAIIGANPKNGKAHFLAARLYERNGFSALAEQEFAKADQYLPKTPDTILELFLLKMEQDDPRAAFDYMRYLAKRFPNDPSLALTRALLMTAENRPREAEMFIQIALTGKAKRVGIATAVGDMRLRQGKPKEALELARYDLAKNPNSFRANIVAGQASFELKQYQDGAAYLKRAYDRNPNDDAFLDVYAKALYKAGMYGEALEPALILMAKATNPITMQNSKQRVLMVMRRTNDQQLIAAVRGADKKLDRTPYQGRLHLALGDVFDSLGKRNLAEECFAKGIEQFPTMGRPYYRLARDLEKDHDYIRAFKLYETAYSLDPDDLQVTAAYARFGMRMENRRNDIAWQLKDWMQKK